MKTKHAQSILLSLLEGTDIEINGTRPWDIQVHNEAVFQRILQEGSLGLGESYMEGWWDCIALEQFFARLLRARLDQKVKYNVNLFLKIMLQRVGCFFYNPQSKSRARIVGEQHYDIGNDLYAAMLDQPTMSYTCGYWKDAENLDAAQAAKLELICRKLQLKPGMEVLDIGCGFGGFAKYAAEHYKVKVVGLTISKEQQSLAQARCAGLAVEIRLQDYRDVQEKFDRVVSIGMFEHVGPKNYAEYMDVVASALKQDEDLFLLHTIGSNTTTSVDAWINRYIFPNGQLPSIKQVGSSIEGRFVMEDWHNFGVDYYKTLMSWHDNFTRSAGQFKENYSPRFCRMWNYYLLSCAGAFYARDIQLWQIVLSKSGVTGRYIAPR